MFRLATPRCLLLAISLATLGSLSASAQQRIAPGPLAVGVLSAADDTPIPGVTVHLGGRYAITTAAGIATFHGVPAGTYPLEVGHPGYERLTTEATLAAGAREPISLRLVPTPPVAVTGRVVLAGDGRPMPGARVEIAPAAVAAAVQGPCHCICAWDGTFTVPELPPGRYSVQVQAPGCAPLRAELQVAADMEPVTWELPRVAAAEDLSITVQDARTGGPVANAEVTVAEAWPRGIVARGLTDAQGRIAFAAVPTTALNWESMVAADSVAGLWEQAGHLMHLALDGGALRGRYGAFQSHMEGQSDGKSATGRWTQSLGDYAPAGTFAVNLGDDPNLLQGSYTVDGEAGTKGGWNWTRLGSSESPGFAGGLTVYVAAAGHQDTAVPLAAGSGSVVVPLDALDEIAEQEPNDELASAQIIAPGATVEAKINTAGDHDCFRFRLPHPALVRLEIKRPSDQWMRAILHRPNGDVVADFSVTGGPMVTDTRALAAGEYVLLCRQHGDNAASAEPYFIRVTCRWAPDPYEPNDDLGTVRTIRPGQELRGFIFPAGDRDHFRFEVKRPSIVRFTSPAHPLWRNVAILDSAGEQVADRGIAGGAGELVGQLSPGHYVLRVRQWNDNDVSLEPYVVRMELQEDDGIDDTEQPAGSVAVLRDLAVDAQVAGTIFPAGDHDYYRVAVPQAGRLHASLLKPPEVWAHLSLRDGGGAELAAVGATGGAGTLTWDAPGPATVYLQVREWNNTAASTNPYTLRTFFEPCDELEALGRNDTEHTASPLALGETVEATIYPNGDNDWYAVTVDFPGVLHLSGRNQDGIWIVQELWDKQGNQIGREGLTSKGADYRWERPVVAGEYLIRVRDWNDNAGYVGPYSLKATLVRAEPAETEPMAADPVRPLKLGEAQSFRIDQAGDRDRFVFDTPAAGKYKLRMHHPVGIWMVAEMFDDRTGERVQEFRYTSTGQSVSEFETHGPTRYRLEVREWNDNGSSPWNGTIAVDDGDRAMTSERLTALADPLDPTLVIFSREEEPDMPRAAAVEIDADGNGNIDTSIPLGGTGQFRYPAEGLYRAVAHLRADSGMLTRTDLWVEAIGPAERTGVQLIVDRPGEGQIVEEDLPVQVRAISYTGAKIARVSASIDGSALPTAYTAPYTFQVPWSTLRGGEHVLTVTATDTTGVEATLHRRFSVSDYFGLLPRDGATMSGTAVRVSWSGGSFGPAAVRYRAKDAEQWQEAVGESGRERVVLLSDLEASVPYEFQPLGGAEPGPVRTVTRVKGLAFGSSRYGANINRDYDQRVPISVRNHGEEPLTVSLVCGRPRTEDLLLSFVGEGSEDKPVELGPGEERQFTLIFSAQDAVHPQFTIPLRIVSADGYSDEAEMAVHVKLPEVKLEWEDLGPTAEGYGRLLRLSNRGDGLTDLALSSDSPDMSVSPRVEHGIFPAGASMEVRALPRLYEGFRSAQAQLAASAVDKTVPFPVTVALKDGEQVHGLWVRPGGEDIDEQQAELLEARLMSGAYLSPEYVDWSKGYSPQDTDGDGRPDRWVVMDNVERILWIGEDTNGDGQVDFAHADIGFDGQYDYSGIKGDTGWEETNLASAWLEMGFKLPGALSGYQPHDVDVVLNDRLVGSLTDTLPQGNFRFRIPPSAFAFNTQGSPEGNQLGIASRHVRGGHYVVTSDFRMKLGLTGTRAWVVATSEQEAREKLQSTPGLSVGAPDLSVNSDELRLSGAAQPTAGDEVLVTAPLRNLGAVAAKEVAVAVFRQDVAGGRVELGRQYVETVPVGAKTVVAVPIQVPAGNYSLTVVVDPDRELADLDRDNDTGAVVVSVAGDPNVPTVQLLEPADGASLADSVTTVKVRATDDVAVARAELRVGGGLWAPMAHEGEGVFSTTALLQPGQHRLTVRAVDDAGNAAEAGAQVTVTAALPEVSITAPAAGASIDAREATVEATCGPRVILAAARVNGGPWQRMELQGGTARAQVRLSFGPCLIEVMGADERAVQRVVGTDVTCTKQREETEEPDLAAPVGDGKIEVAGIGPVDLFSPGGPAAVPTQGAAIAGAPAAPGEQPGDEAREDTGPLPGLDGELMAALDEEEAEEPADEEMDGEEWLTGDVAENDPGNDEEAAAQEATDSEPTGDVGDFPGDVGDFEHPDGDTPTGDEPQEDPEGAMTPPAVAPTPPTGAGTVAVQQRQTDWYCTNRPNISVKFQLPDWLKRLNLPKPGTAEYDAMVAKLLQRMKEQGMDTAPFERFQEALRRKAKGLQAPDELPGFLESLGLASAKPQNPAELQAWREKMLAGVDAWWLRLLASGDPGLVAAGLKARGEAMGQFDKALQDSADAVLTEIQGNQKLVEDCLNSVPHTNFAMFIATWNETESLSGEQITRVGRFINGAFALTWGVGKLFQNPAVRRGLAAVGNKAAWMGEAGVARLAQKLNLPPGKLKSALGYVQQGLEKTRARLNGGLQGKLSTAGKNFANSPAGKAAAQQLRRDAQQAERLLTRIAQAQAGGDKKLYRQLVLELQTNKTAQALLNGPKYSPNFRAALDKTHRAYGRLTDRGVRQQVLAAAQRGEGEAGKALQAILRKNPALKAGDVTMRARTVTGLKAGAYGRDRDVVYQWVTRDGKVLGDVHHKVTGPVYNNELKRITGKTAEQLDHVVTSRWHPEAYNAGRFKDPRNGQKVLEEIIQGKRAGHLARPEDIRDAVIHKGRKAFDEAAKLTGAEANRATSDGMRQALKDYERHVAGYLKNRGLNPNTALPPRLKQGLDVFQKVQQGLQDGSCTVEQAKAMLNALGKASKSGAPVTPQTIVNDLGHYIEFINKWGLKAG